MRDFMVSQCKKLEVAVLKVDVGVLKRVAFLKVGFLKIVFLKQRQEIGQEIVSYFVAF